MTKKKLLRILNYVKNKFYRQATIIFVAKDLSDIRLVKPRITITYDFLAMDKAHVIESDDWDFCIIAKIGFFETTI